MRLRMSSGRSPRTSAEMASPLRQCFRYSCPSALTALGRSGTQSRYTMPAADATVFQAREAALRTADAALDAGP